MSVMKKEEWINGIMESASEIHEAEVNPFLFHKITDRLNKPENAFGSSLKLNLNWAAVISIVIAMNISVFIIYQSKIHRQTETAAFEAFANEMNTLTTYNY
jgi:hypothetical protein